MSEIFAICGNYEVDGKWKRDNVSFKGWFVKNDDDSFVGICLDEVDVPKRDYIKHTTQPKTELVPKFLVGTLKKRDDGHDYGITFYMLSNYGSIAPIKYTIPDLGSEHPDEKGFREWITYNGPQRHGDARVNIQQYNGSAKAEDFLRREFKKLRDVNGNKRFIDEVLCS